MYRFTMDEFKDIRDKTEIKVKPLALTHVLHFNKVVRGQWMSVWPTGTCWNSFGIIFWGAVIGTPTISPASVRKRHFGWGSFGHQWRLHWFLSLYSCSPLNGKEKKITFYSCKVAPWWALFSYKGLSLWFIYNTGLNTLTLMWQRADSVVAAAFSCETSDCGAASRYFLRQFYNQIRSFWFAPQRRQRAAMSYCKSRMKGNA